MGYLADVIADSRGGGLGRNSAAAPSGTDAAAHAGNEPTASLGFDAALSGPEARSAGEVRSPTARRGRWRRPERDAGHRRPKEPPDPRPVPFETERTEAHGSKRISDFLQGEGEMPAAGSTDASERSGTEDVVPSASTDRGALGAWQDTIAHEVIEARHDPVDRHARPAPERLEAGAPRAPAPESNARPDEAPAATFARSPGAKVEAGRIAANRPETDATAVAQPVRPRAPAMPRSKGRGEHARPEPAEPTVQIGQVDVITYAPAPPRHAPGRPSRALASRMYLKTL